MYRWDSFENELLFKQFSSTENLFTVLDVLSLELSSELKLSTEHELSSKHVLQFRE